MLARENTISEKEQHIEGLLCQKDREIGSLQLVITNLQTQTQHISQYTPAAMEEAVVAAVARRESELRVLVAQREEEVKEAIAHREAELMGAMRQREAEVLQAWEARESDIRSEVEQRLREAEEQVQWVTDQHEVLRVEEERLDGVRSELEQKIQKLEANTKGKALFICNDNPLRFDSTQRQSSTGGSQKPPSVESYATHRTIPRKAHDTFHLRHTSLSSRARD